MPELHTNSNKTDSVSVQDDKLQKRRARLAAWNQKRAQAENNDAEKSKVEPLKLQEWIKRRQQKSATPDSNTSESAQTSTTIKPIVRAKIRLQNGVQSKIAPKKRSIFEDDDDEDNNTYKKKLFRIPNDALNEKISQTDEGDEDEDQALERIRQAESDLQPSLQALHKEPQHDLSENEDSDVADEHDEVAQQRLLSEKLNKLNNKEKKLKALDYSQLEYTPVRKQFYTGPDDTTEHANALRSSLGEIKVRGSRCPLPISLWSQLSLPSVIMKVIEEKLGYSKPSPIQSQALPAIMSGRDIIGVANTGSGKTLAFVIPLIRHIIDQPPLQLGDGPMGVILTPTRELALQIQKELINFTQALALSVCCCYGGHPIESQIAELKRGAEIIVGTPGRVIDLLAANSGRVTNLRRTTFLVLDEADRMFDMGFEPQVNKVLSQIRPDKQMVLFSATFPKKLESLARSSLEDPVEIIAGGISVVAAQIKQKVEIIDETEDIASKKTQVLLRTIDEFSIDDPEGKILIFVDKQEAADELMVRLLQSQILCIAIHGGKEQMDRKHALKQFSDNEGPRVLIATSIAARGLDVKGLNLVINYDAPSHMEDYVHRVGRTGRAGASGTAVTFVLMSQEREIRDLVRAMKMSGMDDEIPSQLKEIADKFFEKVKSGKEKYNSGFGGKGLENLQERRDNDREMEMKMYGEAKETNGSSNSGQARKAVSAEAIEAAGIKLPDFEIIEGKAPETSGPDRCKFHSRIEINDLPQKARWVVVNRDSLSKIIDATSTSITNKGQYYPPNTKLPKPTIKYGREIPPPPKLYLLVEGLTKAAVQEANKLLREKMIEGVDVATEEDAKAPIGRYNV